jgi:hypothetical protein
VVGVRSDAVGSAGVQQLPCIARLSCLASQGWYDCRVNALRDVLHSEQQYVAVVAACTLTPEPETEGLLAGLDGECSLCMLLLAQMHHWLFCLLRNRQQPRQCICTMQAQHEPTFKTEML